MLRARVLLVGGLSSTLVACSLLLGEGFTGGERAEPAEGGSGDSVATESGGGSEGGALTDGGICVGGPNVTGWSSFGPTTPPATMVSILPDELLVNVTTTGLDQSLSEALLFERDFVSGDLRLSFDVTVNKNPSLHYVPGCALTIEDDRGKRMLDTGPVVVNELGDFLETFDPSDGQLLDLSRTVTSLTSSPTDHHVEVAVSVRDLTLSITRTIDGVSTTIDSIALLARPHRVVVLCGMPWAQQVVVGAATQEVRVKGFSLTTVCP